MIDPLMIVICSEKRINCDHLLRIQATDQVRQQRVRHLSHLVVSTALTPAQRRDCRACRAWFHTIWEFGKVQSRCFAKATKSNQWSTIWITELPENLGNGMKLWKLFSENVWALQPSATPRMDSKTPSMKLPLGQAKLKTMRPHHGQFEISTLTSLTSLSHSLLLGLQCLHWEKFWSQRQQTQTGFFWQKGFTVDEMSSGIPVAGVEKELVDKPIQNSSLAPWCTIIMILGGSLVGVTSLVANPFCVCMELTEKTPADKTHLSAWLKTELVKVSLTPVTPRQGTPRLLVHAGFVLSIPTIPFLRDVAWIMDPYPFRPPWPSLRCSSQCIKT